MRKILVIDDELAIPAASMDFSEAYPVPGFKYEFAPTFEQAQRRLRYEPPPSIILLDVRFEGLGDRHGLEILEKLSKDVPRVPVVMMSSRREPDILIRSWELGALSYVIKWADNPDFHKDLKQRVERFATYEPEQLILGSSYRIEQLREAIAAVAGSDATVLVQGETGTGKDLVARSIHQQGARAAKPLIAVNCAAIPETLIESTLFGHQKGAFSGADSAQRGLVEAADGGVLFFDEIGDLKLGLQATLLRFLDQSEFMRVGATDVRTVDVQIIAATNRDLQERVTKGMFRDDLFHRLNRFPIRTPPLQQCKDDIPILAEHFLRIERGKRFKPVRGFSQRVLDVFTDFSWPGNVRELKSEIEYAFIVCSSSEIDEGSLSERLTQAAVQRVDAPSLDDRQEFDLKRYLAYSALSLIKRVHEEESRARYVGANKRVAVRLGLNPVNGLARKLLQICRDCPELSAEVAQISSATERASGDQGK